MVKNAWLVWTGFLPGHVRGERTLNVSSIPTCYIPTIDSGLGGGRDSDNKRMDEHNKECRDQYDADKLLKVYYTDKKLKHTNELCTKKQIGRPNV